MKIKDFPTMLYARHKKLLIFIGIIFVLVFPLVFRTNDYLLTVAVTMLIYIILTSGLNVTNGYVGLFSLGSAGFMCIGAYTAALMSTLIGTNFIITLLCSALLTALIGALLAIPTNRFEGFYFAITTMGFSEIVRLIALNWSSLTGGPNGIHSIPRPSILGIKIADTFMYYYLVLIILCILLYCIYRILHSRVGRAWISIRENADAARSLGVSVSLYKLTNFSVMGFVMGVGGCMMAYFYRYISPDMFLLDNGHEVLAMVILGGMGSMAGPVVGSMILLTCMEVFRSVSTYRMIAYAVVVIVMMWVRPQGIVGSTNTVLTQSRMFLKKKKSRK